MNCATPLPKTELKGTFCAQDPRCACTAFELKLAREDLWRSPCPAGECEHSSIPTLARGLRKLWVSDCRAIVKCFMTLRRRNVWPTWHTDSRS
eukprot:6209789-Pleurochrysis_carterae.AAC.7